MFAGAELMGHAETRLIKKKQNQHIKIISRNVLA